MTTWFTSDMHFGHTNIISYCGRPFTDVDHMTAALIENWNQYVMPDDVVYVLGDAVMGQRDKTLPHIKSLNGQKYLVPGNHDNVHPMYASKKAYDLAMEAYLDVFDDILDPCIDFDDFYLLCHFPYNVPDATDYQGRDYSAWEPKDEGKVLLCGHVHDAWTHQFTPKGTLQINVGSDVWGYRPVRFELLKAYALTVEEMKGNHA